MSNRRILVVVAILCIVTSLLIRVACVASASSGIERWTLAPELPTRARELPERRRPSARPFSRKPDPYAGWDRLCEPVVAPPCSVDSDCSRSPDGRPQRCVVPWWADKPVPVAEREHVCAAPSPGAAERRWRKSRLDAVVEHVCRGGCSKRELGAFLALVAQRESTWRPWKIHRLNEDLRANRRAWARIAPKYSGNPHHRDPSRWQGMGLFGSNAALFAFLWDPAAPPEVLCREIESIDTYLARARIAARKQASLGLAPTWATVHGALATGDIRPTEGSLERFRGPARRAGIDPDARVSAGDFGQPLGQDVASRRLAAEILRGRIDLRLGHHFGELGLGS